MIDKFKKFKLTACCWYAAAVCAFSFFCYTVQFGNKGKTNQISASMIVYGGIPWNGSKSHRRRYLSREVICMRH